MNEVEKMYSNANIRQDRMCEWTCRGSEFCSTNCEHYESTQLYYPPFTAEKQLELIKWLCTNTYRNYFKICFDFKCKTWYMECDLYSTANKKDFTEVLAQVTQCIWQDLTEEEKQQVKGILE